MSLALRPYMNAGVALVGAGVIALTPVTASPAAVHVPALRSAATVELTAFTNPLETWASVGQATVGNLLDIGHYLVGHPAPVLQQLIANRMTDANTLGTILQTVATGLQGWLSPWSPDGIAHYARVAADQARAGDLRGATDSLYNGIVNRFKFKVGLPLLGTLAIWQSVAKDVYTIATELPYALAIGPFQYSFTAIKTFQMAVGDTLQGFGDALKARDLVTAASFLINAPAVITGAVLNGYSYFDTAGVLGEDGVINQLIRYTRERVAQALKPKPTAAVAPRSDVDSAISDSTAASAITPSTNPATASSGTAVPTKPGSAPAPADSTKSESTSTAIDTTAAASTTTSQEAAVPVAKPVAGPTPTQAVKDVEKAAAKAISTAGKQITSATNKFGEDLKKTFTKPRKPAKTDASTKPTKPDSDSSGANKGQKASSGAAK